MFSPARNLQKFYREVYYRERSQFFDDRANRRCPCVVTINVLYSFLGRTTICLPRRVTTRVDSRSRRILKICLRSRPGAIGFRVHCFALRFPIPCERVRFSGKSEERGFSHQNGCPATCFACCFSDDQESARFFESRADQRSLPTLETRSTKIVKP